MQDKNKRVFVINGSASANSSNQQLIAWLAGMTNDFFNFNVWEDLKTLPHFDPALALENVPKTILDFRSAIAAADAILICTPEYIFSIPGGLKNALEWCVSTTLFSNKPTGIITASASGEKGHEELKLIMKTLMANFTAGTTLLIRGIRGKIDANGCITENTTREKVLEFTRSFRQLVYESEPPKTE